MEIELSEEHKAFRTAVREFAEKEIAPLVDEAEKNEKFPEELFPKMGALGFLCVRYPEQYGGAGADKIAECISVEETARVSCGIASAFMVQSGIGTEVIYKYGTEEQKHDYLVPAIRGQKISAFGLSEPDAGSDAANIKTRAVRDGDYFVINGTKMFITNGPICDYVFLTAVTDRTKSPSRGISAILVDKGTPGFTCRKLDKVGNRSAETGELVFEDCRVPVTNLLGEEGSGFRYVMGTLTGGRISHAGRSVGTAQAAFDESLAYAKERVQFGQPIGKFQAIAFKLARMAMEIEAARWFMYRAAYLYEQGVPCDKEASMCKLFASEVAVRATEDAMQIHAGYGYMSDSRIQRYFRDARLFTITEGTSEVQQLVISRQLGL